jgi:hypothetical protein
VNEDLKVFFLLKSCLNRVCLAGESSGGSSTLVLSPDRSQKATFLAGSGSHHSGAPPDMWLSVGCALIGLWVLTSALPALVRNLIVLYLSRDTYDDVPNVNIWRIYYLVEIAIGLWLILGAKGFRKLYWWAQTAGHNSSA